MEENKNNKIIMEENIKKMNNKQKERNPGFDLCRILGMLDIVVYHIIINGNLFFKYKKHIKKLIYMQILTQWHISNFGIISGIVGYKTNKYSNLMYLWICVFFYSLIIHYFYKKIYPNKVKYRKRIEYFFPLIFNHYWYFTSYFKMYLFLPLINKGILYADKFELKIIIISMFGIFFIWKDLMSDNPNNFCSDRSIICLLVYYITGAYIGKNIINEHISKNIFYYLILIIIFISLSYITYYSTFYLGNKKLNIVLKKLFYNANNSIGIVIQSISIILICGQIKYNKHIGKFISFFGPLTFSVYLTHNHIDLRNNLFTHLFDKYSPDLSFKSILSLILLKGTIIFYICIIIDYFRALLFKFLKIRKICIFIEKIFNVFQILFPVK